MVITIARTNNHHGKSILLANNSWYFSQIFNTNGNDRMLASSDSRMKGRAKCHEAFITVAPITLRRAICLLCCSV